jgi:hypothetical protein
MSDKLFSEEMAGESVVWAVEVEKDRGPYTIAILPDCYDEVWIESVATTKYLIQLLQRAVDYCEREDK